ncbi:uncharacterized protein DUF466 [Kribbella sp. VKM Ac-2527]|uniref:Uncharacterized protein DUF466 n=1 Tax=Kribbella caucasensis TaxID=2512215 RepID=A0A4R6K452_9ACTN|nr:YbdD/YjiX family protein [Kribbella sp. VKM Ac-2527]TDO43989.1 uncharacterized protein DUF466 [Kribbella sp. VKM Ac-2527]
MRSAALRRILRQLHWYIREFTGEAEYDRYRARLTDGPPPTRREYERMRARHREDQAHNRCC